MSQIKIKQIEGLQDKLDLLEASAASGSLKSKYTQAGHTFVAGQVISYYGGSWILADASSADKLGRLVVESVEDANTFVAVQLGNIEVSTWDLTPGSFYVVDESGSGSFEEFVDENSPSFAYSNPIMQAITATTAQVLPWRPSLGGIVIEQGIEHTQADLVPNQTNGAGSSTGISLEFTPFGGNEVQVYINGVAVTETYGDKTGDVYFSNDGGTTSATQSQLVAGSVLYWNSNNAGFEIGAGDSIDLVYERSSSES